MGELKLALVALFFYFAVLTIPPAHAHLGEKIIATGEGGGEAVWYVVQECPEAKDTDLSPGVYKKASDQQWNKPVVLGKVLKKEQSLGLIQLDKFSSHTERYEALAVIDGKITFFHNNSSPGDSTTIKVIGSRDAQVVDASHQRPRVINLPLISDHKDLNYMIFDYDVNESEQVVFFSVRNATGTYAEDEGITFAVRLGYRPKSSSEVKLKGTILVLDYKFRSKDELARLHRPAQDGCYSALAYFEHLITPATTDHMVVEFWKRKQQEALQKNNLCDLPLLEPNSNRLRFSSLPRHQIDWHTNFGELKIISSFDPQGVGLPEVSVYSYQATATVIGSLATRRLDKAPTSDSEISSALLVARSNNTNWFSAVINTHLYLVQHTREGVKMLLLDDRENFSSLEDFSLAVFPNPEAENSNLACLSFKFMNSATNKSYTNCYAVKDLPKNTAMLCTDRVRINSQFFATDDFSRRFHRRDSELLFDEVTPSKNYYSEYDRSRVHVEINKSLKTDSVVKGFRAPQQSMEVTKNVAFHTYNTAELEENKDGLYVIDGRGQATAAVTGKLVQSAAAKARASHILASNSYPLSSPNEGTIFASAVGLTSGGSEDSFRVALVFNDAETESLVYPVVVSADANSLIDMSFHPEIRVKGDSIFLSAFLLLADKDSAGEMKDKRILCLDFILRKNKDQKSYRANKFEFKIVNWLDEGEFTKEAVLANLRSGIVHKVANNSADYNLTYGERLQKTSLSAVSPKDDVTEGGSYLLNSYFDRPEMGRVAVKVFAIDKTFRHGAYEFSLVWEVITHQNNREWFVRDIKLPFSSFAGISLQCQRNFKKGINSFGIVYAIADKRTQNNMGGFYSLFVNLEGDTKPDQKDKIVEYFKTPVNMLLSADKNPQFDAAQHRLFVDNAGMLYWSDTLATAMDSDNVTVVNMATGQKCSPSVNGLKLMPIVKDGSDEFKMFKAPGSWRVKKGEFVVARLPGIFGQVEKEADEFAEVIFSDLNAQLEKLGNPMSPAEHQLLVVSKEVKSFVKKSIVGSWLSTNRNSAAMWSHRNSLLDLFYIHGDSVISTSFNTTQRVMQENFQAMGDSLAAGHKPVLIVDLADLKQLNRFEEGGIQTPYRISYLKEKRSYGSSEELSTGSPAYDNIKVDALTPQPLYVIAAEGKNLSTVDFDRRSPPQYSVLLIGTEEEWQDLKSRFSIHERSVRAHEAFARKEVSDPSTERKIELLSEVIQEKRALFKEIRYDGRGIVPKHEIGDVAQVERKVLEYFVVRTQALAAEKHENVFVAVVKLVNRLRHELRIESAAVENGVLTINKDFIENIIGEMYNLPLNLKSLPKNDPLNVLADRSATNRWYEAGYAGNFDVKMKVINGILGQTNSGDQKAIPASFVVFGKKGSGKTYLFTTLVKMLGLKYYDFNASMEENKDAQVFFINFGNITSTYVAGGGGEDMPGNTMMQHFNTFLRLPKGKRGFIIFDDAHLTSAKVRDDLFAKIRSLFEAKSLSNSINTRNITLFMTFNPTNDPEKIKKVVGNSTSEPTPLQLAIATFASEDNKVDESFFNRWGHIVNLDYFSPSAKSNELTLKLRETAKSVFSLQNIFFTVASDTVKKIVDRFPKLNARDFLSATVKSVGDMVKKSQRSEGGGLYLTVPKRHSHKSPGSGAGGGSIVHEGEQLETFIAENFNVIDFESSASGYAYFLDLIINNFRLNFYQDLINAINGEILFTATPELMKLKLRPTLYALKAHLMERQKQSLRELNFDQKVISKHLRLSSLDRLDSLLAEVSPGDAHYYPDIFAKMNHHQSVAPYLLGHEGTKEEEPSRLNMLAEYQERLKPILRTYLNCLLFVEGQPELQNEKIRAWAQRLPAGELQLTNEPASQVSGMLAQFMVDFFSDHTLLENIHPELYGQASNYDIARIFCYVIDKAIARLPWEHYSIFLAKALSVLSTDLSIAASMGAQNFLFDAKKSLFSPFAMDMIFENIRSSMYGQTLWSETEESQHSSAFAAKVNHLFFDPVARK